MPIYEYRCRTCGEHFEARRPMADADRPIACPDGHLEAARLLSVFASVGSSSAPALAPVGGCGAPGGCACASS